MSDDIDSVLEEIVSEDLAAVTFVRDDVQLQFGSPPSLNVYTPIIVRSTAGTCRTGDAGFADALTGQLNKRVREAVRRKAERLELRSRTGQRSRSPFEPTTTKGPKRCSISAAMAPFLSSSSARLFPHNSPGVQAPDPARKGNPGNQHHPGRRLGNRNSCCHRQTIHGPTGEADVSNKSRLAGYQVDRI
jgi:hypothetical protein